MGWQWGYETGVGSQSRVEEDAYSENLSGHAQRPSRGEALVSQDIRVKAGKFCRDHTDVSLSPLRMVHPANPY